MLRGWIAIVVLVLFTGAYFLDLIVAAVTGRNVPVSEHRTFWLTILISIVLTAINVGISKLHER